MWEKMPERIDYQINFLIIFNFPDIFLWEQLEEI